jgi:hypothetical protein
MEIGQPFFMELGRSGVGEVGREKIFSPSPHLPIPPNIGTCISTCTGSSLSRMGRGRKGLLELGKRMIIFGVIGGVDYEQKSQQKHKKE